MKIFFDTNVLLDLILKRAGYEDAQKILQLTKEDEWTRAYLSYLSVANAAYVLRKLSVAEVVKYVRRIAKVFNILPCNDMQLLSAERIGSPDYEDSLQIACAEEAGCNIIVTNNKAHFENASQLPVYTPKEFVSLLK